MNLLDEVLVEHIFSGGSEIISASILLFKKVRKKKCRNKKWGSCEDRQEDCRKPNRCIRSDEAILVKNDTFLWS